MMYSVCEAGYAGSMRTACLLWRHRRACTSWNTTDSCLKGARGATQRFAGAACDLAKQAPPAAPAKAQAAASQDEGSRDGTDLRACLLSMPGCIIALTFFVTLHLSGHRAVPAEISILHVTGGGGKVVEGRPAVASRDGRSFAAALEHLNQAKGPNIGVAIGSVVRLCD